VESRLKHLDVNAVLLAIVGAVHGAAAHAVPNAGHVVHAQFAYPEPLRNPYRFTLQGTHRSDGGCAFRPPDLVLGPKERAIEGRQVSVDNESCTTVIEVGEPDVGPRLQSVEPVGGAVRRVNVRENAGSTPSGDIGPNRAAPNLCASPPAAGMRLPKRIYAGMRGFRFLPSAQVPTRRIRSMGNRSARPLCGGSPGSIESAGRYQVTWYAYVDLELTITRPHLTWWWNGHCATGSYGEGYWWWQSWTGWNNTSYSTAWLGRTCDRANMHERAHYYNNAVCAYEVQIRVEDARVHGFYNGYMSGGMFETWNNRSCFPLHWSHRLTRLY
jgi:hypothetical protein